MSTNTNARTTGDHQWNQLIELLERQHATLAAATGHANSVRMQVSALALYEKVEKSDINGVEEIHDPEVALRMVDNAPVLATRELLWMRQAPTKQDFEVSLARNSSALAKGVTVRGIRQSGCDDTAGTAYQRELEEMGVRVRTAPLVPFPLAVVDDTMAMVGRGGPAPHLTLVRCPSVVALLRRVFEHCWNLTTTAPAVAPLGCDDLGESGTAQALTDQELLILRLWARGRKDATIARELRISPRTLRRVVSSLLRKLGVSSRFEAGMAATRTPGLLAQTGGHPVEIELS
ncbi:helix-turn-helix transcriptional regulator [Actinosynnema pretiosum]|uniref:Helix-turn-helix transcriptional regulator n=1 Tax=Actinosynnema pretiosum TaxID=42197 RepID=A0A290Z6C7_9PSEU|nr:LuxR C-terminal-related transcriptional regulator [Actinosynnema pretiosum]ATE54587.1 helix-turn-helix transcriptional regulator [Actinosynnema pretiosum]